MSKSLALRQSELLLRRSLIVDLPADIERDFAHAADDNARELLGAMLLSVPVGDEPDDGQLKRSLRIEREGKVVKVVAGGLSAPHATYVEFGTRTARAHPFFFSNFRLKKKKLFARYTRVLAKAAKKYSA